MLEAAVAILLMPRTRRLKEANQTTRDITAALEPWMNPHGLNDQQPYRLEVAIQQLVAQSRDLVPSRDGGLQIRRE